MTQIKAWFNNYRYKLKLDDYLPVTDMAPKRGGRPKKPPVDVGYVGYQQAPMMNPEIPKVAPSNDPRQYCGFCCQKETPSNLLTCAKCSNSGHQKCLQFNDQLWDRCQGDSTWECIECKSCSVCRIQGEDEKLLFCDMCDCAMHMHCLTPPLTVIPQGSWQCPPCSVPKPHTRLPKFSAPQAGGENETMADGDEDDHGQVDTPQPSLPGFYFDAARGKYFPKAT